MFESETEHSRRSLFARKGEAVPTPAVEAGIRPRISDNPNDDFNGPEKKLASVTILSSLITRQNPRVRVTAPESFHDEEGLENRMMALRPPEGFSIPIWQSVPDGEEKAIAPLETALNGRRHPFTVRLQTSDFRELMAYSIITERTYQDILETAVKKYLNMVSA